MVSGIYYFWDNEKDELAYIGKSIKVEERIKDHLKPSRNKLSIDKALNSNPLRYEYGLLLHCNVDELDENEILSIQMYNPKLNFTTGGDGGLKSEETKKRMSEAQMGHFVSDETKNKISNKRKEYYKTHEVWNKGKKCPQISESNSKEKHWNYGKKTPLDTSIKISKKSNKSGFLRVYKKKRHDCKQGFTWIYSYYDKNGKRKEISSISIEKLEEKVKKRGLVWEEL